MYVCMYVCMYACVLDGCVCLLHVALFLNIVVVVVIIIVVVVIIIVIIIIIVVIIIVYLHRDPVSLSSLTSSSLMECMQLLLYQPLTLSCSGLG